MNRLAWHLLLSVGLGGVILALDAHVRPDAAAAQPVAGTRYVGSTDLGGTIELIVARDSTQVVLFAATGIPCGPGTRGVIEDAIRIDDDQTFTHDGDLQVFGTFPVEGQATGTLRIKALDVRPVPRSQVSPGSPGLSSCESEETSWTAEAQTTPEPPSPGDRQPGTARTIMNSLGLMDCYQLGLMDRAQDEAAGKVITGRPNGFGLSADGRTYTFRNAQGIQVEVRPSFDGVPSAAGREPIIRVSFGLLTTSGQEDNAHIMSCLAVYIVGYWEAPL